MPSIRAKIKALHAIATGASPTAAAAAAGLSLATVRRARAATADLPPSGWAAALKDRRNNSGRKKTAKIDPRFWQAFRADFLRLVRPTAAAAYLRACQWARERDIPCPPRAAIYRAVRQIPRKTLVLAREGAVALDALYPAQRRHVYDLSALDRLNADGWKMNLFVRLPPYSDGKPRRVIRPILLAVQDVATRKIVGWRIGESESAELILSALAQVLPVGIPGTLHIDNTRAMSARWLVGDDARRRFKPAASAEDAFTGVLGELGVKVSHTGLIPTLAKTAAGRRRHRGRGQAKPVERSFQVLDDRICRHPAFTEHYTGASIGSKPENYHEGIDGADWDEVEAVAAQVIADYNAETGRAAVPLAAAGGKSADALFAEQVAAKPPRPATEEDYDALLLPGETTKIRKDGTFTLKAGAAAGFGRNWYHAEQLLEFAGRNLLVRYDPTRLHAPVSVSDGRGKHICRAIVQKAAGFGDTKAAAAHNSARTRENNAEIKAKKAREEKDAAVLQELARVAAGRTAAVRPANIKDAPVIKIGKAARKERATTPPATSPATLATAYRRYQQQGE